MDRPTQTVQHERAANQLTADTSHQVPVNAVGRIRLQSTLFACSQIGQYLLTHEEKFADEGRTEEEKQSRCDEDGGIEQEEGPWGPPKNV